MRAILFTNASLFDGVGPAARPGAQVLVADGLVQAVSDRAIGAPADAEVVDLGGRTLMPGLIDAHVHIWATDLDIVKLITRRTEYLAAFAYRSLAAMLDRGFTTVRDAGGTDVGFAQALRDGLAVGPRLLHAGRFLSQTGGHGDFRRAGDFACACELRDGGGARFTHVVDSPDEVRKAVREELRNGAHQTAAQITGGPQGGVAQPRPRPRHRRPRSGSCSSTTRRSKRRPVRMAAGRLVALAAGLGDWLFSGAALFVLSSFVLSPGDLGAFSAFMTVFCLGSLPRQPTWHPRRPFTTARRGAPVRELGLCARSSTAATLILCGRSTSQEAGRDGGRQGRLPRGADAGDDLGRGEGR